MSKAFWEGFRTGFTKGSMIGVPVAAAFVIGLALGSWSHPYEVCKRLHTTQEDVSKCAWIRENP